MPSKGLRLPILLAQKEVFRSASPQFKLTPAGYLDYLLTQNKPSIISATVDDKTGYISEVKVRSKKRFSTGKSVTTDDCSIQSRSPYYTQEIGSPLFRKISIWFDWNQIEKFTEDALATQKAGTPGTPVMTEVIDAMTSALNGLIGDINNDLLDVQAAAFGKNIVTGSNAATTINFPLNITTNPLNGGMTKVMSDAMANEMMLNGASSIGSGLINQFYLQQAQKGLDAGGLDTSRFRLPGFYYDPYAESKWGANEFGIFEKDAVQFVNICKFRGPKSKHWGTSEFGTITWPIIDSLGGGLGLRSLEFDFQAKEVDCPQEGVIIGGGEAYAAYGGEVIDTGRGMQFDLMCYFGQVNIPDDAYEATDRMYQNNGTLRYEATNV
jgi:hypothetical protein